MPLSLMLFYNIIRDAINSYNTGSLPYFSFIGFMTVAGVVPSLYAVVKYPAFLHAVPAHPTGYCCAVVRDFQPDGNN